MIRYKRDLLTAIDKLLLEVRAAKVFYESQQDYSGESFFSVSPAWEVQLCKENVRIACTMLDLLRKLRKEFDEST